MWLLVIVLMTAPAGISPVIVLNSFATYEDCKPERDRIGFAMAESYPHDTSFRIACELRDQRPSLQPVCYEHKAQNLFTMMSNSLPDPPPQLASIHRSH